MEAFFPKGSPIIYYGAQGFTMNKLILPNGFGLGPYQEQRTTLLVPPFTPNAGAYTIEVWVDPTNITRDPNQANNRVTLPITLVAPRIGGATPTGPTALPNTQTPGNQPATPSKTTAPLIKRPGQENTMVPR